MKTRNGKVKQQSIKINRPPATICWQRLNIASVWILITAEINNAAVERAFHCLFILSDMLTIGYSRGGKRKEGAGGHLLWLICSCMWVTQTHTQPHTAITHTWVSSDVHGLEVPALDDSKCESACGGQVAKWEHDLSKVDTFLWEHTHKQRKKISFSFTFTFSTDTIIQRDIH